MEIIDETGQLRSNEAVREVLAFVETEIVRHPMTMTQDGVPVLGHYIVIREALIELLGRRAAAGENL